MIGQRDQGERAPSPIRRRVETEVERRLKRYEAMTWRRERWGAVLLTEREYEALEAERAVLELKSVMQEFRNIERTARDEHEKRLRKARAQLRFGEYVALYQSGHFEVLDEVYRESLYAQAFRGVQVQVAARMGVSKQRVSILLRNASRVLDWLSEFDGDYVGWSQDRRGKWRLIAPCARVERAKVLTVDFAPWQAETRRTA